MSLSGYAAETMIPKNYEMKIHLWNVGVWCSLVAMRLAQQISIMAEPVHELMSYVRSRKLDEMLPHKPEPKQWLRYYRNNLKVVKALGNWRPDLFGCGDEVVALLKGSRAISLAARQQTDEYRAFIDRHKNMKLDHQRRLIERLIRNERRAYAAHLEEMREVMSDPACVGMDDDDGAAFGQDIERIPELLFYFRVVLPCMLAYQVHPTHLLRRARQGDASAIQCLVRLDEMTIHEPAIEAWARHKDGKTRLLRQQMLRDWAKDGIGVGRYSLQQVQQSFGGFIQAVIERFGRYIDWSKPHLGWQEPKVTADDIRKLFLAVHNDRIALCPSYSASIERLMNLQIPSWTRRVSEHRNLWIKCLPGGHDKT